MVELYTMMRYLQFDALQERGLGHFDSWAADFGEKVTAIELSPEGTGFRSKTRFAKFYNLPELMNLWKESADIQTADMLNLPVPKAEYITVTTEPSEHQQEMVANLAERADQVRNRTVDPSVDNLLKITSDGRKLALDQRLQNELLPDDPDSKVNACVENICSVWKDSMDTKGTQLVFCDLSTPHYDGTFNVYDDMKNKLIEKGIPPEEIAYIHDANTELQKAELFAKVRKGQVRVLLGSTQKMGAGSNVQTKLIALHHLDCPWRPSDIEQREGRILRQGNENPEVKIYQYVTKGTFDAYNWGLVENKQKFIGQIMTSKSPARSAEDVDATALSYAEVKALATGDDRIREKMELDIEVSKLRMLKSSHTAQIYELEDKISLYYPQKMAQTELYIEALQKDLPVLMEHPIKDDSFSMLVSGQLYTERKAAGEAMIAACKTMTDPNQKINLGEYRGFPMTLSLNGQTFQVSLKQNLSYTAEIANDPSGNITRINHVLEKIPDQLKIQKERLLTLQSELEQAKEEVKRPFPKEEELMQKSERLIQLNKELDLDEKQTNQAPQEEKEEKSSILKSLKQFETPPISTQEKPNKEVVR
ncbi:MAG: helicase [Clostridium sp.]|nr:helicase [Clostridium sp.]